MTTSNANFNLSEIKSSNDLILNSIKNLDTLKTGIQNDISLLSTISLTDKSSSNNVSSVMKNLTNVIGSIGSLENNLHSQINRFSIFYEDGLLATKQMQEQQDNVNKIINDETENNNKSLESVENEKNNKMRLVEINSYYEKKYSEQIKIMKIIIVTCVLSLILWLIDSRQFLPIPSFIFAILISVSITIGSITVFYKCYDLFMRNNIDYDQFDFDIPEYKLPKIDTSKIIGLTGTTGPTQPQDESSKQCVNEECCPSGFAYNSDLNYCTLSIR
jgi:hypothetical protein